MPEVLRLCCSGVRGNYYVFSYTLQLVLAT
jgi:hypothetical protein